MKKSLLIILCAFALSSCSKKSTIEPEVKPPTNPPVETKWLNPIKVASYNIEYNNLNPANPADSWGNRKTLVANIFDKYSPDIVGVQEAYFSQLSDMMGLMPDYAYVGKSVNGSLSADRQLTVDIVYKKAKIEILNWDSFWLSSTPTVAGKDWGAGQLRICTWAFVIDKSTNKQFYFFNVHLDFTGTEAREKSVKLLLDTIPKISKGYPAVLTGDFNFSQHDIFYPQIRSGKILIDSYELAAERTNITRSTFNGYDVNATGDRRIDQIYLKGGVTLKVNSWAIRADSFNGRYPSDHFPVMIDLSFEAD
ncbi:endonuclease/exonuclease/phosphatase family protein [Pedobacter sp. ASV1-7]|uniref:endonuclease/exonuclease/phosphatase family protein n=1 Tax=Pedobacter sp. ASV1-7 TaxID=3145237 RepID=UPI0032E91DBF